MVSRRSSRPNAGARNEDTTKPPARWPSNQKRRVGQLRRPPNPATAKIKTGHYSNSRPI
jgi:hypothetical protein